MAYISCSSQQVESTVYGWVSSNWLKNTYSLEESHDRNNNFTNVISCRCNIALSDNPPSGKKVGVTITVGGNSHEWILFDTSPAAVLFSGIESGNPVICSFESRLIDICNENDDCPDGQKCVDGECVDCEDQSATHFKLREEYSELASISGALVPYQITGLYPLPVTTPLEITLENHNQYRSWWRILFCDSAGNPAPYNGAFQLNANNGYQFGTGGNVPSGNIVFGPWDNAPDVAGGGNIYISKVVVDYVDESFPITEPDCSGITPESPVEPTPPIPETPPVQPPPVEPPYIEEYPPPDEPLPPAPWPQPWEPPYTPPDKPLPPSAPETGCECEIYLGSILLQIVDSIYDSIWSAYDRLNTCFQFVSGLFGSFQGFCAALLNLLYQSVMYIVNAYQIEQAKNRTKISEVVDELKTFNQKFSEFVDKYEPVQIENEYRTQSHRIIDNLDSTLTRL